MMKHIKILFLFLLGISLVSPAWGDWRLDLESGMVFLTSNDIQVPNDTGTFFSLNEGFRVDTPSFYRFRIGYNFHKKHTVSLLIAPLSIKASGTSNKDIFFFEKNFPSDTSLDAVYTFNSYRLTYRYDFVHTDKWKAGLGFTAKIRDALIRLESEDIRSEKTNVGFVPLLHFRFQWNFAPPLGVLLRGDALASPGGQGRAEDVLMALVYDLNTNLRLKVGYRVVEGGADVEEVYNFAWINYFVMGAVIEF